MVPFLLVILDVELMVCLDKIGLIGANVNMDHLDKSSALAISNRNSYSTKVDVQSC